jgi:hypothetical protein
VCVPASSALELLLSFLPRAVADDAHPASHRR